MSPSGFGCSKFSSTRIEGRFCLVQCFSNLKCSFALMELLLLRLDVRVQSVHRGRKRIRLVGFKHLSPQPFLLVLEVFVLCQQPAGPLGCAFSQLPVNAISSDLFEQRRSLVFPTFQELCELTLRQHNGPRELLVIQTNPLGIESGHFAPQQPHGISRLIEDLEVVIPPVAIAVLRDLPLRNERPRSAAVGDARQRVVGVSGHEGARLVDVAFGNFPHPRQFVVQGQRQGVQECRFPTARRPSDEEQAALMQRWGSEIQDVLSLQRGEVFDFQFEDLHARSSCWSSWMSS